MQCVILAGGLGTRLWPVTKTIPKALIPINGRPFADYQLALLARQQTTEVVYCVGFLGEQIRNHVGDGSAFGLKVRYIDEGDKLKGTAGALRLALDAGLLAETFFVLYGDSFLPIAFAPVLAAYHAAGRPALMTVMRNKDRWDRSNVIFTPPMVTLYDKSCDDATRARMAYIDYGLSVVSRGLIADNVPSRTTADLADVFKRLSIAGQLAGFEITQRFFEVGSPSGIADFCRHVAEFGLCG
jgi:N-acetyl-alpha-D-muramate 1-phosphate uridylyltransferase